MYFLYNLGVNAEIEGAKREEFERVITDWKYHPKK
jgi:hypothetical protein